MSVMKSTMPTKPSKYRGLLVLGGGALVAVSVAMMSGTSWLPETQAQPTPAVVADGALSVGDTLTFAQPFGNMTLTVRNIDGDMVTVADADGDTMTVNTEQLTGGTLPADDTERNAAHMMDVVKARAASGYYERHKGQNGAWSD